MLRVSDLTVAYDRHPAVHHLDGVFASGSLTAIVGPNGAGKSTLLKTLVGLKRPASGSVDLGGLKSRDIAYLPQAAELDLHFPITVADVVLMGRWSAFGAFGGASRAMRDRAARALEAVGLDGFAERVVGTLSVGQLQRALFARLMLQDASLILLDEPFSAIDAKTTADLLDLVRRWHDEKRTVIAVLHDLPLVRAHFPSTLLLARECLGWGATSDVLTPANLDRARSVAEAWDESAEVCAKAA
jgi:zinc/manganese transport system ATP-binding protein